MLKIPAEINFEFEKYFRLFASIRQSSTRMLINRPIGKSVTCGNTKPARCSANVFFWTDFINAVLVYHLPIIKLYLLFQGCSVIVAGPFCKAGE